MYNHNHSYDSYLSNTSPYFKSKYAHLAMSETNSMELLDRLEAIPITSSHHRPAPEINLLGDFQTFATHTKLAFMALVRNDAALRAANVLSLITQNVMILYAASLEHDINLAARFIGIGMTTLPIFYTSFRTSHTWVEWLLWGFVVVMLVIGGIVRYPERWVYQGMTIFYHFEHS